MRSTFPCLAALAALSGCGAPADTFAGIENVAVETYNVIGATPQSIRAEMDRVGPIDPNDGTRNHAKVRWRIEWRWDEPTPGRCNLGSTRTIFTANVLMPRLVSPEVPADVRVGRERYRAKLLAHEAGHIRNAWRRRDEVRAAVAGATCATANAAGNAVIASINADDRTYDRSTRHGVLQGVSYP